jgi:hypothetical protein
MRINDVPLFREWAAFAKESGACEQCQFPWHDGICECKFGAENDDLMVGLEKLAQGLVAEGHDPS